MSIESLRRRARELTTDVHALSLASRDDRTPAIAKVPIVLTVALAASPVDPVPDFLPVVGYLDDLILVPLGVALSVRLVPDEVMADCRVRAEDAHVGTTRWIGAALVALAWVGLVALAAAVFL